MNPDLHRITQDFKYDLTGKIGLEIYQGDFIPPEEVKQTKVGAWLAVNIDEIKDDRFGIPSRKLDFILIHNVPQDIIQKHEAELWRVLRPHGALYVSSPISFSWTYRGWQVIVHRADEQSWAAMWAKKIPEHPFSVGTTQDNAVRIVNKTGRRTKREPEEIGQNELGMIIKWYLADCVLYLERKERNTPYVVVDIGPKEL